MTTTSSAPSPDRRKGVLHRITSRWWRILLLWFVIATPVVLMIRAIVVPTYEAFALLQVQPISHRLYENPGPEITTFDSVLPYLQTQVNLITADRVLIAALTSPEVKNLNFITKSDDPRADLRENLDAQIVKDAYLIRVALELSNGSEAAVIVNAVINSYLTYSGEFKRSENSKLRASLSAQREKIRYEIKSRRGALQALYSKIRESDVSPLNDSGSEGDPTRPTFRSVTEKMWEFITSEMVKTDLELIRAQADLDAHLAADQEEADQKRKQRIAELKLDVAALVKQKANLAKYYAQSKVDNKNFDYDSSESELLSHQLKELLTAEDQLKKELEELEFKASQEDYRVVQVDEAKVPKVPTNNKRTEYMVCAANAILLMLLGLFLLIPVDTAAVNSPSSKQPPHDEFGR
jgi:uncharacterized protein involved in exopolysaccharide biosynthesis